MKNLATALVAAQAELPAVEKNATNPHFGSKFVSLDHLIAKTKPVLTKHGLAIVQMASHLDGSPALTTTIVHAGSGEAISDTLPLVLAKQDMQGLGAALTYARRYGWASALGISDEDDDDGNSVSNTGSRPTAAEGQPVTGGGTQAAGAGSPAATFTWASGKHQGKTLEDTDRSYIEWYAEKGPKEDVRAVCNAFLLGEELVAVGASEVDPWNDPDSDLPFDRTIDGLGN